MYFSVASSTSQQSSNHLPITLSLTCSDFVYTSTFLNNLLAAVNHSVPLQSYKFNFNLFNVMFFLLCQNQANTEPPACNLYTHATSLSATKSFAGYQ